MIDKIIIYKGSKHDFEAFVKSQIDDNDQSIPFMELIQHYNARLRANDSGVKESELAERIRVDNCIVKADDYGSVLEHVIANFSTVVTLNNDIGCLFVHNPPRRVEESLRIQWENKIVYKESPYVQIDRDKLKNIYEKINDCILGQTQCKKDIITALYRLSKVKNDRPAVLLLYGPSGVGKTETGKCLSEALGGELLRIQFSMMQTTEAYNYVFGSEHSKASFARDLLGRETNVILIDEFDKVNPIFYNAFYQLFDEGKYVDANYDVDLNNSIFLCTCNYMSEEEIKKGLGIPMFSRLGSCIKYDELRNIDKKQIINNWFDEIIGHLDNEEKEIIEATDIKEWFMNNVNRFDNIRTLKIHMENAVYKELTEHFVCNTGNEM